MSLPSISFTAEVDASAFEREWETSMQRFAARLDDVSLEAARAGVVEAQQDHPYTDRTQNLTNTAYARKAAGGRGAGGRFEASGGAYMAWPMFYGSYVDQGTSRSRPYPFTPKAERAAQRELRKGIERVIAELREMVK